MRMRPLPEAQAPSSKVRLPETPVLLPSMASSGASTRKRARPLPFCRSQLRGSAPAAERDQTEQEQRLPERHRTSTSTRVRVSRSTSVGRRSTAGSAPRSTTAAQPSPG